MRWMPSRKRGHGFDACPQAITLVLSVLLTVLVTPAPASATKWLGAVMLKNNYVVSTGQELADGPGVHFWSRYRPQTSLPLKSCRSSVMMS